MEVNEFLKEKYGFNGSVIFNTHRLSIKKGILTTLYCLPDKDYGIDFIRGLFLKFYKSEQFVRVRENNEVLEIKNILGSNYCDISLLFQDDCLLIETALDNTMKGASGQAVQNMNIMYGLEEDTGLRGVPLFP